MAECFQTGSTAPAQDREHRRLRGGGLVGSGYALPFGLAPLRETGAAPRTMQGRAGFTSAIANDGETAGCRMRGEPAAAPVTAPPWSPSPRRYDDRYALLIDFRYAVNIFLRRELEIRLIE